MIKIVKDIKDAEYITHAGKFHSDEIFGTVLLEKIFGEIKLIRLPEVNENDVKNKFVFDIGGGKFDHHQLGGNGERESGIKYASFGLLWKKYGKEYLKKINANNIEDCFVMFDKNFVEYIDADDNGQVKYENIDINLVTLPSIIGSFNPNWDENIEPDECFEKAIQFAKIVFDKKMQSIISKCNAKKFVEEAIEKSENGILILEKFMPYKEFLLESKNEKASKILYAVFKSNRKGYTIQAIPKKIGSFENRKKFPDNWCGLRDEELQKVTGVKTATFCHNAGFICVTDEFEDALKLARMAVEN